MKFYMEMTPCGLMVPKKKKIGPHSKQDMLATGDLGLSLVDWHLVYHGKYKVSMMENDGNEVNDVIWLEDCE